MSFDLNPSPSMTRCRGAEASPLRSRRDPARLVPRAVCKAAFGPFCANVRRLSCLTPTQKDIAVVLAKATLKRGFSVLLLSSLSELTQTRPHAVPFAGLGKNDLSPGLAALAGLGIVRIEERDALESGALPVTKITLFANAAEWSVRASDWRYSAADERALEEHWEACFQRFTPQLDGLVDDADLMDARAQTSAEAVAAHESDARGVEPRLDGRAVRSVCSESRNAEGAENIAETRGVPKVGTPYLDRDRKTRQKTSQSSQIRLDRLTREERERLKALVAGDARELLFAAKQIIGEDSWEDRSHGSPNGYRWTMRVRAGGEHASKARAVFAELLSPEYYVRTTNAAAAHSIWTSLGGAQLDATRLGKNGSRQNFYKESLKTT